MDEKKLRQRINRIRKGLTIIEKEINHIYVDNDEQSCGTAVAVLKECDEYLTSNKLNQIGHKSILHKKMKAVLNAVRKSN